jgi:hypothetical protein
MKMKHVNDKLKYIVKKQNKKRETLSNEFIKEQNITNNLNTLIPENSKKRKMVDIDNIKVDILIKTPSTHKIQEEKKEMKNITLLPQPPVQPFEQNHKPLNKNMLVNNPFSSNSLINNKNKISLPQNSNANKPPVMNEFQRAMALKNK